MTGGGSGVKDGSSDSGMEARGRLGLDSILSKPSLEFTKGGLLL